jgi:cytoskeletal protein RodZ
MMKRDAKKLSLALLISSTLLLTVLTVSITALNAQTPQSSSPDKSQATAASPGAPTSAKTTPPSSASTSSSSTTPAKTQTTSANAAGLVWINTDTGVYHKQGTRWYGKTKHGKYMLEADAIKAGYKPAK